jgi:hypothetical protein
VQPLFVLVAVIVFFCALRGLSIFVAKLFVPTFGGPLLRGSANSSDLVHCACADDKSGKSTLSLRDWSNLYDVHQNGLRRILSMVVSLAVLCGYISSFRGARHILCAIPDLPDSEHPGEILFPVCFFAVFDRGAVYGTPDSDKSYGLFVQRLVSNPRRILYIS